MNGVSSGLTARADTGLVPTAKQHGRATFAWVTPPGQSSVPLDGSKVEEAEHVVESFLHQAMPGFATFSGIGKPNLITIKGQRLAGFTSAPAPGVLLFGYVVESMTEGALFKKEDGMFHVVLKYSAGRAEHEDTEDSLEKMFGNLRME